MDDVLLLPFKKNAAHRADAPHTKGEKCVLSRLALQYQARHTESQECQNRRFGNR